jgi:hypothetical protein
VIGCPSTKPASQEISSIGTGTILRRAVDRRQWVLPPLLRPGMPPWSGQLE